MGKSGRSRCFRKAENNGSNPFSSTSIPTGRVILTRMRTGADAVGLTERWLHLMNGPNFIRGMGEPGVSARFGNERTLVQIQVPRPSFLQPPKARLMQNIPADSESAGQSARSHEHSTEWPDRV